MDYCSTRDANHRVTISEAIRRGLAPDGGLYIPTEWPTFTSDQWPTTDRLDAIAAEVLQPFFADDSLQNSLPELSRRALNFESPLVTLDERCAVLELFHGPTAAFKDYGARFLAQCLNQIHRRTQQPLTILVATSGDTGGAVASAFHALSGIRVVVLYPKGRISSRQEKQLTCWGDNIAALAIRGVFDDCQRLVKESFNDAWWQSNFELSSANSINIGRLLPQMTYYVASALHYYRQTGVAPSFVIPTGNLGNALSCIWAKRIGFPIQNIVLATNANRTTIDFIETGRWKPRATVATLANAMDVGEPSNMERLRSLYPDLDKLREHVEVYSVVDTTIAETIRHGESRWNQAWCPHTACGMAVIEDKLNTTSGREGHFIAVATAHPAKFEDVVEPLLGHEVPIPPALNALLSLPSQSTTILPTQDALRNAVVEAF